MQPLLKVQNLKKHFLVNGKLLKAVDDVSFDVEEGTVLALVGESGCGKSTVGKTILRLFSPTSGSVFFKDISIFDLPDNKLKTLRSEMQMIFQNPYSSLNPRMTIREIIAEPLYIHGREKGNENGKVKELLNAVGLPTSCMGRFPLDFSGGQRQRIGIARALSLSPKFIICDEPVASLDVSIQAQIINLLRDLQNKFNLTYLFISHDLALVKYLSNKVAVMYLGKMVEFATTEELFANPLHPYTKALISAVPLSNPVLEKKRQRVILQGDPPSPFEPPKGCYFSSRCPFAKKICSETAPEWKEHSERHFAACHCC